MAWRRCHGRISSNRRRWQGEGHTSTTVRSSHYVHPTTSFPVSMCRLSRLDRHALGHHISPPGSPPPVLILMMMLSCHVTHVLSLSDSESRTRTRTRMRPRMREWHPKCLTRRGSRAPTGECMHMCMCMLHAHDACCMHMMPKKVTGEGRERNISCGHGHGHGHGHGPQIPLTPQ